MPGHVTPVLRRQKKEDEGFKAHLGYMDIITNKETKKYKKKKTKHNKNIYHLHGSL